MKDLARSSARQTTSRPAGRPEDRSRSFATLRMTSMRLRFVRFLLSELLTQETSGKKEGPEGPSFSCQKGQCTVVEPQYPVHTVTPTFWKVFISSNTLLMPSRSQVPVTIALGDTFLDSTIWSICG